MKFRSITDHWRAASVLCLLIFAPLPTCLAGESPPPARPSSSVLDQPIDMAGNPAHFIVAFPGGQSVPDNDPRIIKTRSRLKQVAQVTGEEEEFIAVRCVKLARYIFDALRVQATPTEVLEAVALHAKAGTQISDTTNNYFQARRLAPNKTHAEAMATLAAGK